jgi:NhaA family Na+:H+ antiporter
MGIFFGLVLGKPIGITLFAAAAVALGWCVLPTRTNWKQMVGAGCLGGIGFTMSIFVSLLAFDDPHTIEHAKTAILFSSTIAALFGTLWLWRVLPRRAAM